MKSKILSIISFSFIAISYADASIVLVTSHPNLDGVTSPDVFIIDTVDTKLATGYAGLGVFSTFTDLEVQSFIASNDIASLATNFVASIGTDNFVIGMTTQNLAPSPGAFAIQNTSFDPSSIIGKSLYTFIGDGLSLGSSGAFALFKHTQTLVADPAPPGTPNEVNLNLGNGTLLLGSTKTIQTTDVALGLTTPTNVSAIQLVPEPSTLLLSAFGVLGLLRRKR